MLDTLTGLDKADVAALRQANTITLHHGDLCFIRAYRERHFDTYFTAAEQRLFCHSSGDTSRYRDIVVTSDVHGWTDDGGRDPRFGEAAPPASAYAALAGNDHRGGVWPTLAGLLRAGDEVRLEWIANGNGYTRNAGLHMDEVHLHVRRENKHRYTFLVAYSVCPDNTARMIKRG